MIGVASDTSAAVGYAIGALALDDNTIGGESRFTSETGPSGYIAHTPDPVNHPLPLTLHEGQQFTMGGDGINDVAFIIGKNRISVFYMVIRLLLIVTDELIYAIIRVIAGKVK